MNLPLQRKVLQKNANVPFPIHLSFPVRVAFLVKPVSSVRSGSSFLILPSFRDVKRIGEFPPVHPQTSAPIIQ
jgi:hypothetical protein